MSKQENPLLALVGNNLPPFAQIKVVHIMPAIEQILADNRAAIATLTAKENPTWDDLVALEILEDRLSRAWSPIEHLSGVKNSDELRPVHAAAQSLISAYGTELGQNEDLFKLYQAVKASQYESLDQAKRKIIDDALLGFQLSGIALEGEARSRFGAIKARLTEIGTTFSNNVLDATAAFTIHLEDNSSYRLRGLPESALAMLAQYAKQAGKAGYLVTLDFPCYNAILTYCDDRELRAEVYKAYMTRASENGPDAGKFDNTKVMEELLALKQELAQLLGFENYAQLSLARKMARQTDTVLDFLQELSTRAYPLAVKEKEELVNWARSNYPALVGEEGLENWDVAYFSEKMKASLYSVSDEVLLPYFPANQACQGLFAVVEKLYGFTIHERHGIEVWHPDVRFFEIHDQQGKVRGKFYLDLYARKNKRGGAWMDVCTSRFLREDYLQIPVAYLTCNFAPPVGGKPALLRHADVVTLFHEFGHGLHHMLTLADLPTSGGMNVEWDAIELPSQIMEFFCFERAGLELISGHYETGEPLPEALLKNLLAAKHFQSAMQTVRQLEFALFDFRMHMNAAAMTGKDIQATLDKVRQEVAVNIPPEWVRFQNAFNHIFSGGYSAGYYSYKWAELLAADGYSKFEEDGILSRQTGEDFLHNVIEPGCSKPMMELYVAYRGRKPTIDALLKYSGLAD